MIPIKQAKEKVEDQLMQIDGVEGVGISKERKKKAIMVYVSRIDTTISEKIPKEIEGHPVKIEVSGKFKAV